MKEEKLQSLYYYYISKRDHMNTIQGGTLSVARSSSNFDHTFPAYRGVSVVDGVGHGLDSLPVVCACRATAHWIPESADMVQPMFGGNGNAQLIPNVPQDEIVLSNETIEIIGEQLLEIADEFTFSNPSKSLIQFEKRCIFVAPEEQTILIPVNRSDKGVDKTTRVSWETCDKSALAGIHYESSSGKMTFEVGDTKKNINLRILTSNDETANLHFIVKLIDECGLFSPTPLTVTLKKLDNLYPDEISIINNLEESRPSSVRDIKSILSDSLNQRTFYMGLSYLCSTADTLSAQFALAFELGRICRPRLRDDVILQALNNFFAEDDI